MEQNNLLMVYMKSEQHCYWEQMFQGTDKDGRLKEPHLNVKIKDKLFFFSVLDDVLQTTEQSNSLNVIPTPFFLTVYNFNTGFLFFRWKN